MQHITLGLCFSCVYVGTIRKSIKLVDSGEHYGDVGEQNPCECCPIFATCKPFLVA